jgi:hypothetical protein
LLTLKILFYVSRSCSFWQNWLCADILLEPNHTRITVERASRILAAAGNGPAHWKSCRSI